MALAALTWVLSDERRATRLLSLSGLTADDLRQGVGDPAVLGAILDFLLNHEADLLAAAADLGVEPRALAAARSELGE